MLEMVARIVVLFLIGPLVLIGIMGLLFLAAGISSRPPRRIRETFLCPVTNRVVTAEFLVPERAAHPTRVVSCTAFSDPGKVACKKKPCRKFAEVSWGPTRGIFPRWALIAGGVVTWRNT